MYAAEPETGARFRVVSEDDCDIFIKENKNKNTMYKTRSDVKLFNVNNWTMIGSLPSARNGTSLTSKHLSWILCLPDSFCVRTKKLFLYQTFYYL